MVHTVKFLERGVKFATFHTFFITELEGIYAVFHEDETEADKTVSSYVLKHFLGSQLNIFFI